MVIPDMICGKCSKAWNRRLDNPVKCPSCGNPRHIRPIRDDEPEVTTEVIKYKQKQEKENSLKDMELPD